LIDFGLALDISETKGIVCRYGGTPLYSAPELLKRQPYDGSKADIWAVGVAFSIMLFGLSVVSECSIPLSEYPFSSHFILPFDLLSLLSVETSDLVLKMLVINPQERASVSQLLAHPALFKISTPTTVGGNYDSDDEFDEFDD
jgi:serine/threonine-protein kinase HSL1, negative regulator of Swe1 kinase